MLEQKELDRQMEILKSMGFGGAHLHPRTGLETPYLSEEFMDRIKGCLAKAKQENLQVYLYDEDRWPSGICGRSCDEGGKIPCAVSSVYKQAL